MSLSPESWAIHVPETAPPGGVYQTFMGAVIIQGADGDWKAVAKLRDGTVRVRNNVGLYLECTRRAGTTYSGRQVVLGTFNKALADLSEWRLLMGYQDGAKPGEAEKAFDFNIRKRGEVNLGEAMKEKFMPFARGQSAPAPLDYLTKNFYPMPVDIIFRVNMDINRVTIGEGLETPTQPQFIRAAMCMFDVGNLTFAADGIVMGSPLNFVGSYATWATDVDVGWLDWT